MCKFRDLENRLWLPGAESREEQEVTASWVRGSFKVMEMGIAQDCECHWIVKPRWLIFITWISLQKKKKHSKGVYFRLRWRIHQGSMGHSLLLSGDCDLRVDGVNHPGHSHPHLHHPDVWALHHHFHMMLPYVRSSHRVPCRKDGRNKGFFLPSLCLEKRCLFRSSSAVSLPLPLGLM